MTNQISDLQDQISQKNSQIQTLQGTINYMQTLLGPVRKGAWNLIETFQSSSGKTDYFYVGSTDLRFNWTWTSSHEQYAVFGFNLYKQGQTIYTESFGFLQNKGTSYAHNIQPAYYYLDITQANLDQWTIAVEVWIPE